MGWFPLLRVSIYVRIFPFCKVFFTLHRIEINFYRFIYINIQQKQSSKNGEFGIQTQDCCINWIEGERALVLLSHGSIIPISPFRQAATAPASRSNSINKLNCVCTYWYPLKRIKVHIHAIFSPPLFFSCACISLIPCFYELFCKYVAFETKSSRELSQKGYK